MPLPVTLKVEPNPREIGEAFRGLAKNLVDFRPAWAAMLPDIANGVAAIIQSQGAAGGSPWPQLAVGYQKRKTRLGKGKAIGVLSGAMLRTVSNERSGLRRMGPDELRFGPKQKYAFIFHFGRDIRGGRRTRGRRGPTSVNQQDRQPARPFIYWTDSMRSKAEKHLDTFLDQRLAQARRAIDGAR